MNQKIGPIFLAKGISKTNALTFFYACFICIGILAGMNFVQGYILSVVLNIPMGDKEQLQATLRSFKKLLPYF